MIKFDILKRFSSEVAFTAEIDCDENTARSIKVGLAVKWAIKNNANLSDANLSDANLSDANLSDANLRNANLRNADLWNTNLSDANLWNAHGVNAYVKCIQIETYPITYTHDVMQIGCERHAIADWRDFDDARIAKMDGKSALKFWRKYKVWIFQTIEMCPAAPTKTDEVQS